MAVVLFLLHLLAGDEHIVTAGSDHVVTAIGRRVPDRLVLAHEQNGNPGSQAT